ARLLELLELARGRECRALPPDHDERNGEKTRQPEDDPVPAFDRPCPAALFLHGRALRIARRCALRARGFRAISSLDASTGCRVSSSAFAVPPQVHIGCSGGQTHALAQSRKRCLTMRSSP